MAKKAPSPSDDPAAGEELSAPGRGPPSQRATGNEIGSASTSSGWISTTGPVDSAMRLQHEAEGVAGHAHQPPRVLTAG